MPAYYTYLISSLPMLHFGQSVPFSYDRFLHICYPVVSEDDRAFFEALPALAVYEYQGREPLLKKLQKFETALRNELVKIRAHRKHVDPLLYLRETEQSDISINHTAINAYRATSILESEKMLDQARWQALDEISEGHFFDRDVLIVYALKLLFLEKWDAIKKNNNLSVLDAVCAKG